MGAPLRTLPHLVGNAGCAAVRRAGSARGRPLLTAHMAALSPTFFSTVRAPAAAVFGGPVEISRLLFLGSRSTPVVCGACQTMNRRRARTCKACAGKLPAYYDATGGSEAAPEAAALQATSAPLTRSAPLPGHWANVLWAAVAVVTLLTAFGLWYARHTSTMRLFCFE